MSCFLEQALHAAAEIALLKSRLHTNFQIFRSYTVHTNALVNSFSLMQLLLYMQNLNLFQKRHLKLLFK